MTCYKHVIPDLSSINKDITCDINYETDNNGCEILRIKCKSNDTTCESSYGCINGGNVVNLVILLAILNMKIIRIIMKYHV